MRLGFPIDYPAPPSIPKDLLDWLVVLFPDTLPFTNDFDLRLIDRSYGAQLVIRRLRDEYLRQNKLGAYQETHVPGSIINAESSKFFRL